MVPSSAVSLDHTEKHKTLGLTDPLHVADGKVKKALIIWNTRMEIPSDKIVPLVLPEPKNIGKLISPVCSAVEGTLVEGKEEVHVNGSMSVASHTDYDGYLANILVP